MIDTIQEAWYNTDMIKRPVFSDVPLKGEDKSFEYIFRLNVYATQLEEYVKKLRLGIMYAQEVIETDIPAFESLLSETRLEEAKTEES